jgi:hypothetical protein
MWPVNPQHPLGDVEGVDLVRDREAVGLVPHGDLVADLEVLILVDDAVALGSPPLSSWSLGSGDGAKESGSQVLRAP